MKSNLVVVTLNTNRLNLTNIRQALNCPHLKRKQYTVYQKLLKTNSRRVRKQKRSAKWYQENANKKKKEGVKLLILNKVEFKIKSIEQEQHYHEKRHNV